MEGAGSLDSAGWSWKQAVEALRLEEPTGPVLDPPHPSPDVARDDASGVCVFLCDGHASASLKASLENKGRIGSGVRPRVMAPRAHPASSQKFFVYVERQCIGFRPRQQICGDGHGSAVAEGPARLISRMCGVE